MHKLIMSSSMSMFKGLNVKKEDNEEEAEATEKSEESPEEDEE